MCPWRASDAERLVHKARHFGLLDELRGARGATGGGLLTTKIGPLLQ